MDEREGKKRGVPIYQTLTMPVSTSLVSPRVPAAGQAEEEEVVKCCHGVWCVISAHRNYVDSYLIPYWKEEVPSPRSTTGIVDAPEINNKPSPTRQDLSTQLFGLLPIAMVHAGAAPRSK